MNERSYIIVITNKRSFLQKQRVMVGDMKLNLIVIGLLATAAMMTACYEGEFAAQDEQVPVVEASAWPEGKVYYTIEGFDAADENDQYTVRMIKLAMQEWSDAGNVQFIERPEGGDYVCRIVKSENNSSTIGYRKDPLIYLISNASQRQATHELGHLLGFTHEHQRPDRDRYITVLWSNIRPEAAGQYQLLDTCLYDVADYAYDYRSVMHYSTSSGTVSAWKKTYTINDASYDEWWPAYLTETDRQKVRDIYGDRAE